MPHNEINVRAFVEIADVLPEIPQKEFEEEVKRRVEAGKFTTSDSVVKIVRYAGDLEDNEVINEVKEREWTLTEARVMVDSLKEGYEELNTYEWKKLVNSPVVKHGFENLQHQLLFEEFEQARKTVKPQILFELFAKLNRPQLNEKVYLLR